MANLQVHEHQTLTEQKTSSLDVLEDGCRDGDIRFGDRYVHFLQSFRFQGYWPNPMGKFTNQNRNQEAEPTRHQFLLAESNTPSPKSNMEEALLIIA